MAAVSVELVGGVARAEVLRAGEFLRPRLLGIDGPHVRIALVGVCASLLAGDDLRIEVRVGRGVHLELVEPAGLVAYDARGGHQRWAADVRVETGGSLVWAAAPMVIAGGADVQRSTVLELDEGARVLVSETLVLGRSGEEGGGLRSTLRCALDRRDLLVEELDLRSPELRSAPGILGDRRVLATVALLGARPDDLSSPPETALAGPGSIARALAAHAHEADAALRGTWDRWRGVVARPGGNDRRAGCVVPQRPGVSSAASSSL
ncbi:urease accessory protein UreD [Saccharopolyspora dendranthemae]|uniref:urease accessory protein UreD n=1 Tax=Saccharopolyspora dendranthemae TaxID=1181886 RepID=UPI0011A8F08C|nr:urease accessory protein UreD [Saccharopolyspora dendranthemae]